MPGSPCPTTGLPVCPAAPLIAEQGVSLKAIHEEQAHQRQQLEHIAAAMGRLANLAETVQKHSTALYGNGHPGLIRRVDRCSGHLKIITWLMGLFAVPVAGAVVTAGCWLIVKVIHS